MSSKDYWQTRETDRLYNKRLGVAEGQLAREYTRSAKKVKTDILNLYYEIKEANEDGTLLMSDLYKYSRYFQLLDNLNTELNRLGEKELRIVNKELNQMYRSTFILTGKQIGFNTQISEIAMNNAINSIWCKDGLQWSDRIWRNKAVLEEAVKNGIVDCVARGASKDEWVKSIMNNMNVGYRQADRLVRTELSHVQNRSTMDKYDEAGVEYYMFITAEDSAECEVCASLDKQIFPISAALEGENLAPIHPNCRCSTLAVFDYKEG